MTTSNVADIARIERAIAVDLARLLGVNPAEVDHDTPLLEVGADSLAFVEMIRMIEKRYGVKLTVRELFEELASVAALASRVKQSFPARWEQTNGSAQNELSRGQAEPANAYVPTETADAIAAPLPGWRRAAHKAPGRETAWRRTGAEPVERDAMLQKPGWRRDTTSSDLLPKVPSGVPRWRRRGPERPSASSRDTSLDEGHRSGSTSVGSMPCHATSDLPRWRRRGPEPGVPAQGELAPSTGKASRARGRTQIAGDSPALGFRRSPNAASPRSSVQPRTGEIALPVDWEAAERPVRFGLSYFGNFNAEPSFWRLMFESARFADENGFEALWLPERHFNEFGGFSPNPSVLAAALARETKRIALRGGSCVAPLHHPARVAEEWALVDQLSGGRAGVAFASGWHRHDFVLANDAFEERHDVMRSHVDVVRRLWSGHPVEFTDRSDRAVEVQTYPRPHQDGMPVWIAALGSPQTFAYAGRIGAGILTNLIDQRLDVLAQNIATYREARAEAGFDPHTGNVAALVHTFLGPDDEQAKEIARRPLERYLASSITLSQKMLNAEGQSSQVSDEDRAILLEAAVERYMAQSALIGSPRSCSELVKRLSAAGVNEIACFVDFGVDASTVLEHLPCIRDLKVLLEKDDASPVSVASPEVCPATEDQALLGLLAQVDGDGSLAFHLRTTLKARGPFQPDAYEWAIEQLVSRHEALRTTFSRDLSEQRIHARLVPEVLFFDFSGLDDATRQDALSEWFKRDDRVAFDLERGPLLRASALKLDDDEHLLVVTAHHIACDGVSKGIVLRELGELYNCRVTGGEAPAEASQFRQLIRRRDQVLVSQLEAHENWWRAKFPNGVPPTALPFDFPPDGTRDYRGQRLKLPLSESLMNEVRRFSAGRGVTTFMTILGAWFAFLSRLTGEEQVTVGVPTGGRSADEGLGAVGFMANLVPVCVRLSEEGTIEELVRETRAAVLDAIEHEQYPYAKLVQLLGGSGKSPLVTTAFNWDQLPVPQLNQLEISYDPQPVSHARFRLGLNFNESPEGVLSYWEYQSAFFEEATVRAIATAFFAFLDRFVSGQSSSLREVDWGEVVTRPTPTQDWEPRAVHYRMRERYEADPDAIAVSDATGRLSRADLHRAATAVRARLEQLGVGKGDRVAISVENSNELAVAFLGVFEAGAAVVPIDREQPLEHLRQIVEDSQVKAVVEGEPLDLFGVPRVALPEPGEEMAPTTEAPEVSPTDIAYVVYTSGSTGAPKGVVVEHGQLDHYCSHIPRVLGIEEGDACLMVSPPHVDLGYTMLFPALTRGATVHLPTRETFRDPVRLANFCEHRHVDHLKITPTHLDAILGAAQGEAVLPHKALICGGEVLPWGLAEKVRALRADLAIYNHYGPAETTIGVLTHRLGRDELSRTRSVPIGMPFGETETCIVDSSLRPVPICVPGELLVAGPSVSRGYLNPQLSEGRFIELEGHQWYRTGDRVRRRADGAIEFIGRTDNQVKIRGFRVELDEVVAATERHPDVSKAAAVVRDDLRGGRGICVYVVPESNRSPLPGGLIDFLRNLLPHYMVPAAVMVLESLPFRAGGKLAVELLPAPKVEVLGQAAAIAPKSEMERKMVGIWKEILEVPELGLEDDFFDLGGHSIHAIKLATAVRTNFGVELPVAAIFEHSTISELLSNWISNTSSSGEMELLEI